MTTCPTCKQSLPLRPPVPAPAPRQAPAPAVGHHEHPLDLDGSVTDRTQSAGHDGAGAEVADEERTSRRAELGRIDRRLVRTAVTDDVLLLHGRDQVLRDRSVVRLVAEFEKVGHACAG